MYDDDREFLLILLFARRRRHRLANDIRHYLTQPLDREGEKKGLDSDCASDKPQADVVKEPQRCLFHRRYGENTAAPPSRSSTG